MIPMDVRYPEIGICGLSCRLCPSYQTQAASRCLGCKSEDRIKVGCPLITCALKKKGVEFCWECTEHQVCEKWAKHRETGKRVDSFKTYQTLEADIAYVRENGVEAFKEQQVKRESILKRLLDEYNEGRSKSYYCIAATVMSVEKLEHALRVAEKSTSGDIKKKAAAMRAILDGIALSKRLSAQVEK
jgi:hypothetical protein